jgi:aldehyde:ferredoxin oxidoreductase
MWSVFSRLSLGDDLHKGKIRMNNKFNGWSGRVLKVDLTERRVEIVPLDLDMAKQYLGGRGLNGRVLYDLASTNVDEFGPDNPVIFGAGPLCGTLIPGASRYTVTAKSPSTNIFSDSSSGGYFGPELKYAGFDQVIVTGISEEPVYLVIEDDDVELRSADKIWGKDTWTAQKEIRRLHGADFQIVCIGQAGENLIRYAGVIHGLKRAAGKYGMGAVMGSKKLKAIAVRGTRGVDIAHPDLLPDFSALLMRTIKESASYKTRSVYGTPYLQDILSPLGVLSTRNFETTMFERYKDIGGIRFTEEYASGMRGCMTCGLHCTHFYSLKEGPLKGTYGEGPEFTLTSMMGDRCGISDMEALLVINRLLNEYGMDCAAFGGLIAWAMDCYERGILTKADTEGLELHWGNADSTIELIHKTAKREGFGNVLAEGERRAPAIVGRGSELHMHHIKGGIVIAEDPRALPGFGLAYLTSTRGSDHLRAYFNLETTPGGAQAAEKLFGSPDAADPRTSKGKGKGVKWHEDLAAVTDSLGICKFNYQRCFDIWELPQLLARACFLVTGVEMSGKELLQAGERIFNVEKAFNVRLGWTREDDNFSNPDKFLEEPLKDGSFKGQVFPLNPMLDEYYEARGWGQDGYQTREKLEELGLQKIANELGTLGKLTDRA